MMSPTAQTSAVKPLAAAVSAESQQYLTFLLSGDMYALGILHIKEIIEYGGLTTVPMMPAFVRGVINLRGSVVSVIDPAVRFGREPSPVTRRSCIVIVEILTETEKHEIGIVVDSVSAVLEIPDDQIEPAPAFGAKIRTDFIKGMGKVHDKFVILLDANRVLSVEEMSELAVGSK